MGTANSRFLSLFYRAINIYLGIGLLLSFPVFMSFLISTPILIVRLIEGHATLGYVLTVGVFFPLFGLVTATWRMLSWPFSLAALASGVYPSFWTWIAPGFALQHTIPLH
jgi:hypothetical protein